MENYPFDTVGLGCDAIDLYNDTYHALKAKFNIQPTGDIDFHLTQFEVFRGFEDVQVRGSFVIKQADHNDCYVLFVQTNASRMGRYERHAINEFQTWALAYLKNDFDRVLIRQETLADKLIELVHPVELDFDDDKAFSDTFYVLVNDRNKAIRGIDRYFRNTVMDVRHDGFVIEIAGHTLIAGHADTMMPGTAVHLADFAERLCKLC
jgi:hypothetical protein